MKETEVKRKPTIDPDVARKRAMDRLVNEEASRMVAEQTEAEDQARKEAAEQVAQAEAKRRADEADVLDIEIRAKLDKAAALTDQLRGVLSEVGEVGAKVADLRATSASWPPPINRTRNEFARSLRRHAIGAKIEPRQLVMSVAWWLDFNRLLLNRA